MPPELIIAAAAAIFTVAVWRDRTTPAALTGWVRTQDTLLTWTLTGSAIILMLAGLILGLPNWIG